MDGFTALADPTRRQIVEILADGEKDASAIAGRFEISKPAISRHLAVLREGGLIEFRKLGQRRIYSVRPSGFGEIDAWLTRYRHLWSDHLDRLEQVLEEDS